MAAQIFPVNAGSVGFQVRERLGPAQLAQLLLTQFDQQSPPKPIFLEEIAAALSMEQVDVESLIQELLGEKSEQFAEVVYQALAKHYCDLIGHTGQKTQSATLELDDAPLSLSQQKRRERGSSLSSRVLKLVDEEGQDEGAVQLENPELLRQLLEDLPHFPDSVIVKMYAYIPSKKKSKTASTQEQRTLLAELLTKLSESPKRRAQFFHLVNEVRAHVSTREQTAYELSFLLHRIENPSCGNAADALEAVEAALGLKPDLVSAKLHQFESKWLKKDEVKELFRSPEFYAKGCIERIIALIEMFLKKRDPVVTDTALKKTFGDPLKEPDSLGAFLHKHRKHLDFCGPYDAKIREESFRTLEETERNKVISDTSWLSADTFRACFGRLADSIRASHPERLCKVTLPKMVSAEKQSEIRALKGPQVQQKIREHQGRVVEALDLVGAIDGPKLETARRALSLYIAAQRLRIGTSQQLVAIEGDEKRSGMWSRTILPALEKWRESLTLPFDIDLKTPYEQHLKVLGQFAQTLTRNRIDPSIIETEAHLLTSLIQSRGEEDELRGQLRDQQIGAVHRCIEVSEPEIFVLLLGGKQVPDLSLLSLNQLWQMLEVLVHIRHIRGKKALKVIAQALGLKLRMQSAPHADDFCIPFEPPHWMHEGLAHAGFFHRCSSNGPYDTQIVEKKKCDAFVIESSEPANEQTALQVWTVVIIKDKAGILPNSAILEHAEIIYIHPGNMDEVPAILSMLKEVGTRRCRNILIAVHGPQMSEGGRELQPLNISIEGYQFGNFTAQAPMLEGLFFPSVCIDVSAVQWIVSGMGKCSRLNKVSLGLGCKNPSGLNPDAPALFKSAFAGITDVRLCTETKEAPSPLALGEIFAGIVAGFPRSLTLDVGLFPQAYWQLVSRQLQHGDCELKVQAFGEGESPDLFKEPVGKAPEPIKYPALTLQSLPKAPLLDLSLLPPAVLNCTDQRDLSLGWLNQLLAQGRVRAISLPHCGLKIDGPEAQLLMEFCSNIVVTEGDFEWLASESEGLFNAADLKRRYEMQVEKPVGDLCEMINKQASTYNLSFEHSEFCQQSPRRLALLLAVLLAASPKQTAKKKKNSSLAIDEGAFQENPKEIVRKLVSHALRTHSSVKELDLQGNELGLVPVETPSGHGLEYEGGGYLQIDASDTEADDFEFETFEPCKTASFKRSALGSQLLSGSTEDLSSKGAEGTESDDFVEMPHIRGVPIERLPWAYQTGEGYLLALCMGQWPQIASLNISECGGDPLQVLGACKQLIDKRRYEEEDLRDTGSNLKTLIIGDHRWSLAMVKRLLQHLDKTQIDEVRMPHSDPAVIACIEEWNVKQTKKSLSNQVASSKEHFGGDIHV